CDSKCGSKRGATGHCQCSTDCCRSCYPKIVAEIKRTTNTSATSNSHCAICGRGRSSGVTCCNRTTGRKCSIFKDIQGWGVSRLHLESSLSSSNIGVID